MTDKQIIIEDCQHFIGGCCQEYLDGVCENHKCDLKIIRELEEKLKRKEQECEELKLDLIEAKAHGDYLNNLALSETLNLVSEQLDQLKAENERLKKELHKNFKEKDTLHLIIDRLLEASGYDTNTASAEDFEDVYEHMRYEQEQLDQLKQTLTEIKEIAKKNLNIHTCAFKGCGYDLITEQILQKSARWNDGV